MNIKEEWSGYAAKVVPVGASRVQIQETRRAFYFGAWAVLNLLMRHANDPATDPDSDDGLNFFEALWRECVEFNGRVISGRDNA